MHYLIEVFCFLLVFIVKLKHKFSDSFSTQRIPLKLKSDKKYCNGGYNGGEGGSYSGGYNGGHGTWEDPTTFVLDNFILIPGDGGHPSGDGGGGGGLGPDEGHNRFVGSGYGAGGGSYSSNKLGLEGVIIVDIVN